MPKSNVIVIAGPTGSGESTIARKLMDRFSNCTKIVPATTRKPRNQEKDGVAYFFLEEKDFLEKVETGEIIEHTHIPTRNMAVVKVSI